MKIFVHAVRTYILVISLGAECFDGEKCHAEQPRLPEALLGMNPPFRQIAVKGREVQGDLTNTPLFVVHEESSCCCR